jgi:hypothetical protein
VSLLTLPITFASAASTGLAQTKPDEEVVAPSLPRDAEVEPEDDVQVMKRMLEEHQAKLEELEALLAQQGQNEEEPELFKFTFRGYADFGFFVPIGNDGVGWIRDIGNEQFPEYAGRYGWVFLGDILATTINSRGEVAELGNAPAADRFDSVDSKGAPGFIVNEVNMRMEVEVAETAILRTSFNIVPRTGSDFALGDFIDLDLAELEWVVTNEPNISFWVGKTLPVFGIEYKDRKSDERFGITPSLIHRYTSGTNLGVKGRAKLFDDWLIIAASVTNGSHTTEQFHFYNEIDTNSGKTISGRIAINIPLGRMVEAIAGHELEIGGSGSWGPQDRATNNEDAMWFVGADLTYRTTEFALKAQWMRGEAPGFPAERVWGLKLKDSGYVEIDYMFLPFLGAMVRAEMRDAFVELTTERAYLTKSLRFTGGLRGVFNPHLVVKAEYLHNREFSGIDEFTNDIFTTSFVVSY